MKTVQLSIIGLTYSQTQKNAYALLLGEDDGPRKLPIVIGAFEAQSIAIALEKDIQPPRPLTHDLFTSLALSYNIYLKEVMIHKLKNGIFYSTLVCELNGEIKQIDSRTSDAIALALRVEVVFKFTLYAIKKSRAEIAVAPDWIALTNSAGPKSGFHSEVTNLDSNPSYSPCLLYTSPSPRD